MGVIRWILGIRLPGWVIGLLAVLGSAWAIDRRARSDERTKLAAQENKQRLDGIAAAKQDYTDANTQNDVSLDDRLTRSELHDSGR